MALLLRSQLEAKRRRAVERAMMQLQVGGVMLPPWEVWCFPRGRGGASPVGGVVLPPWEGWCFPRGRCGASPEAGRLLPLVSLSIFLSWQQVLVDSFSAPTPEVASS